MILINGKEFLELKFSDVEKFLSDFDEEESFFVELKNNDISTKDLIKEICAFSNTFGGYIFLGIEDNKIITGCKDWTEEKINNSIRNLMSPVPIFDIKKLTKNNTKIFVIKIEEGTMPLYITNKGIIYERVSSSSFPIKDSSSINRLLDKRKENIKKIENKLYIPDINENINNLCGYIDLGFSITFKNAKKIYNRILNVNYEEISEIIKKTNNSFSISRVGNSICITIGDSKIENSHYNMLAPARLANFMEILPDGSFRSRIILASSPESNVVSINSILFMEGLFRDIYSVVFKKDLCKNFIEARLYEKLTTIKIFEPKIMTSINDENHEKFEKYYYNHKEKYGSNIVVNSNRMPISDFYLIDKAAFQKNKIKFDDSNILEQLFRTQYFLLGYIDAFESDENTDEN
ncbi:MAG: ATP-binding protein [bacterium]|nr:ATP-binding protein [bacterium]